jgi:RsiW-degrading membrane proteinase PrsW (M82 family)
MTRAANPDASAGPDRAAAARRILIIAVLLSAVCGAMFLFDHLRPRNDELTGSLVGAYPLRVRVMYWAVLASWALALGTAAVSAMPGLLDSGAARWLRARDPRLVIAAELVVPFACYPLAVMLGHPLLLLACVPSTAFAAWGIYHLQRYRRMPVRVPAFAFGWGALIAAGFGGAMNLLYLADGMSIVLVPRMKQVLTATIANPRGGQDLLDWLAGRGPLPPSAHSLVTAIQLIQSGLALDAGVFEELAKGAGIAVLFLLCRRWFDGPVSGVVVGAMVGLGFNLAESVDYMSAGDALSQYWARQSVGLMGSHVAFTALAGAGFGVAGLLADRRSRRLAIGCGLAAAIGAHFMNDVCLGALGRAEQSWFTPSPTMFTLVIQPLTLLVLQGPFVAAYVLLLRRGRRDQAAGLARELAVEARAGTGAINSAEIPILLDPGRRFRLRVLAFRRRGGIGAYRYLGRLQAAQLDLATERWHRAHQPADPWDPVETELRSRVLRLKRHPAMTDGQAAHHRAEVSA